MRKKNTIEKDFSEILLLLERISQESGIQIITEKNKEQGTDNLRYLQEDLQNLSFYIKKAKETCFNNDDAIIHFLYRMHLSLLSISGISEDMYKLICDASGFSCDARMPRVFKKLSKKDIPEIIKVCRAEKLDKSVSLFEEYLDQQRERKRICLVAFLENKPVGYATFVWRSPYILFKKQSIAHIDDFIIFPSFRRQGLGSRLLYFLEKEVVKKTEALGVGIPLHNDYCLAQKFFVKQGYEPREDCVTDEYRSLTKGSSVLVDNGLVIWLEKWIRR